MSIQPFWKPANQQNDRIRQYISSKQSGAARQASNLIGRSQLIFRCTNFSLCRQFLFRMGTERNQSRYAHQTPIGALNFQIFVISIFASSQFLPLSYIIHI
ncbi:hypothetical protein FGO68_gene8582 [Halteria grandinella]|uniref:Uncharacterized protein n=1 Tax=Halteria grandinella TaxID=5974 RepID=A0A8J8ND80_HALGN|nr:hypothetical protein FGO68_gene8582 [Halteria grandinella]